MTLKIHTTLTVELFAGLMAHARQSTDLHAELALDPDFAPYFARFRAETEAYNYTYKYMCPKSRLTSKDRTRSDAFLLLFTLAETYAKYGRIDKPTARAGQKLHAIMLHYTRSAARHRQLAKTGYINSLLRDIADQITGEELALIFGAEELINHLKASQREYELEYDARLHEQVERPETATRMQPRLTEWINYDFLPALRYHALKAGGSFQALYDTLRGLIETANSIAREHRKRLAAKRKAAREEKREAESANIALSDRVEQERPDADIKEAGPARATEPSGPTTLSARSALRPAEKTVDKTVRLCPCQGPIWPIGNIERSASAEPGQSVHRREKPVFAP